MSLHPGPRLRLALPAAAASALSRLTSRKRAIRYWAQMQTPYAWSITTLKPPTFGPQRACGPITYAALLLHHIFASYSKSNLDCLIVDTDSKNIHLETSPSLVPTLRLHSSPLYHRSLVIAALVGNDSSQTIYTESALAKPWRFRNKSHCLIRRQPSCCSPFGRSFLDFAQFPTTITLLGSSARRPPQA
ncbi:hypothetical protein G7046_g9365 [Stylonectria norvegica]|nr:hypothetical protein G7046_g9365 [Stylonectria norvegica]